MRCFIDMDGVLVDFLAAALKIHNRSWESLERGVWHGSATAFSMSPDEFWSPFTEEAWATMPPTATCYELINMLASKFGMENLCILSYPVSASSCAGKWTWCQKNLPMFEGRINLSTCKHFSAHKDAVLVDDQFANVMSFEDSGGKGVLVPYFSNFAHNEPVMESVKKQIDKINV